MPDIDPRKLNFRGDDEYAPGPDGRIYNRQGNETWQSKYDHNVQETNANRQEQQRLANEQKRKDEEREKQIREQNSQRSSNDSTPSGGGGATLGLGGLLTGIAGLFAGYLGCAVVVGGLMLLFAFIGFLEYHSRGLIQFFRDALGVIGKIFTMPFTAWPSLFALMKTLIRAKMRLRLKLCCEEVRIK